jgi:hypothetical protein
VTPIPSTKSIIEENRSNESILCVCMVPVTMTVVIANWCSGDGDGDVS